MTATIGLGWRPETAGVALARSDLAFVEVIAESVPADVDRLPAALIALKNRNVDIIPHGLGLSLGGAERPSLERIEVLARAASVLDASIVSEHLAFVRAGSRGVGHLLPVPRTRDMVAILVENIRTVQDRLPVPLTVEPIASVFEWPDAEMTEADFVAEVIERSGAMLLLDLANVYVNSQNFGFDPSGSTARAVLRSTRRMANTRSSVSGRIVPDLTARLILLSRNLLDCNLGNESNGAYYGTVPRLLRSSSFK